MKGFLRVLSMLFLCRLILIGASAGAQAIPTVQTVPASSHPAIPSGLKVTCTTGPNTGNPSPTCPVVKFNGYTYWAYSYIDNRVAMGIVAYDSSGNFVKQWEKSGARYVWQITVDSANKTVQFAGQSNATVSLTWAELASAFTTPTVQTVPSSSHPAIPSGLKVTCTTGPNSLNPSPTCPVVKMNGYTYWAYSYIDNRVAMGIVAYDPSGNFVKQWEKSGARYVWQITVDSANKTVQFAGQSNATVSLTWAELASAFTTPTVQTVPSSSHPAIPSGLKVTCTTGPNSLNPSPTCPVVKMNGYTYWAYSYIDNRVAMGIVAYDPSGNFVKQWEKSGARYVWQITVNNSNKTVQFAGQSNATVSLTWAELASVFPVPGTESSSNTTNSPDPEVVAGLPRLTLQPLQ